MAEGEVPRRTRDVDECEFDERIPGVAGLGDVDRDVETPERVQICGSGGEFVALRVERCVLHAFGPVDERELGVVCIELSDEAGHSHRLARAVDAAIVDHVEPAGRRLGPRLPPVRRHHHRAVADGRGETLDRLVERDPHDPAGIGGRAHRTARTDRLDRRIADRLAGEQVGHPHQQFIAGHEHVGSDVGPLHPRVDRAVRPVVVAARRHRRVGLDAQHDRPARRIERRGQVDDGLGRCVGLTIGVDDRLQHHGPVRVALAECRRTSTRGSRETRRYSVRLRPAMPSPRVGRG